MKRGVVQAMERAVEHAVEWAVERAVEQAVEQAVVRVVKTALAAGLPQATPTPRAPRTVVAPSQTASVWQAVVSRHRRQVAWARNRGWALI